MLDLFGRKARARIADLEACNHRLGQALRDMDQGIFDMSQKSSWIDMRPIFQRLLTRTNIRINAEHDRVTNLLLPELQRTYNDNGSD